MNLFGKNKSTGNVPIDENEEKLTFVFLNRIEPVVYARLGIGGVDVQAEELINTIERLETEGTIFAYEMNPLILDYLVRTKAVKIKKYSGTLDKCVIVRRQELMDLLMKSKDHLEKQLEENRCPYVCEKCGETHYIDATHYRVDLEFSISGGVHMDVKYSDVPIHSIESSAVFTGLNEVNASLKYRALHKLDPVRYSFLTNLKQALRDVANRIYMDSGVRESNIYIFGLPYKDFMNEFISDALDDESSTTGFITHMRMIERESKKNFDKIQEIRIKINELEKEIHRKRIEMIDAESANDYEKAAKLKYDLIPQIEYQRADREKELWKVLLETYECI